MGTGSTTDEIARYCVEASTADLPEEVRERLKQHLLDFVGVVLGGREHAGSSPAVERAVRTLSGADAAAEATVLPTGERRSAEHAALLNGTFAHSLDFDDTHRGSSLHPGAPVIPAALAVAEREGATTEALLAAVAAGYDVTCTLGRAANPDAHYARGFHVTATCGTFGAAAAAGVVAGLDAEGFASAFGVAGSQAAGSLQFLANGAWNKRLHPGLAARRGVTAAALAAAGFRGAARPVEGDHGFLAGYTDDPDYAAFERLGVDHAVTETALKPYPCCRYMHAAIDALLELSGEVDPADVSSVAVDLPRSGVTLTGEPIAAKRRPENVVDCQFSMPFAAALALTRGEAGLPAFLDAGSRLDDPDLRRLMDATDVRTTDEVQSRFPDQWAARVVVEADETYERFVETARGEPERPLGWDGVAAKFDAVGRSVGLSEGRRAEIVEVVRTLESRELADLTGALRGAEPDR
ncbi:MmgE/PrpD family protein [Halomarina pelagica]|uniref:MmgE/PrpD family protein n=1 Tax=Halomarina pelagica TaxID=2961599 RepID=UPI0020C3B09C|nr:MmgE/PrpD family protein [Halomarina sp. BND7]